jgi:hypothetical protein
MTQRLWASPFQATSRLWLACPLLNRGLPKNPFLPAPEHQTTGGSPSRARCVC